MDKKNKKKNASKKMKKSRMNKSIRIKKNNKSSLLMKIRDNSKKRDSTMIDSYSRRNVSMGVNDFKHLKPLCPALPPLIPAPSTIADRIRAAKRLHMTRRDMTEQKIVNNILTHNNPSDVQNFEVLYISNKNE